MISDIIISFLDNKHGIHYYTCMPVTKSLRERQVGTHHKAFVCLFLIYSILFFSDKVIPTKEKKEKDKLKLKKKKKNADDLVSLNDSVFFIYQVNRVIHIIFAH